MRKAFRMIDTDNSGAELLIQLCRLCTLRLLVIALRQLLRRDRMHIAGGLITLYIAGRRHLSADRPGHGQGWGHPAAYT